MKRRTTEPGKGQPDDLETAQESKASEEIADEKLDAVSGGTGGSRKSRKIAPRRTAFGADATRGSEQV